MEALLNLIFINHDYSAEKVEVATEENAMKKKVEPVAVEPVAVEQVVMDPGISRRNSIKSAHPV